MTAPLAWPGDGSENVEMLPPVSPPPGGSRVLDTAPEGVGRGRSAKTTTRQTLWIAGRLPSLNEVIAAAKGSGGRGRAYAKMKRDIGEMVWAEAKRARLKPVGRVRLHFLWVEKDRRRDPDNVSSAGRKFILDGLVKAGVLPGDGWKAIESWSDTFSVSAAHGVAVTIQEVDVAL